MTTATKKQFRYTKRLAHFETVQAQLIKIMEINQGRFYEMEFNSGNHLLEVYFQGCAHVELVEIYTRELLQNRKHLYWAWFQNQKRRKDESILNAFQNLYIEIPKMASTLPAAYYREEYEHEIKEWLESDDASELLRAFLSNSETLFL